MTALRGRPRTPLSFGETKIEGDENTMGPEQELTFGQKAKMGLQAAGAFARNPKALVALVKYQRAERKRQRTQPQQVKTTEE